MQVSWPEPRMRAQPGSVIPGTTGRAVLHAISWSAVLTGPVRNSRVIAGRGGDRPHGRHAAQIAAYRAIPLRRVLGEETRAVIGRPDLGARDLAVDDWAEGLPG